MALLRNEVADNKKWDLSILFKTEEDFEKAFKEAEKDIPTILEYKGKLNKGNAIDCFRANSVLSRKIEKLYSYAHLQKDEDTSNQASQALAERASMLLTKYASTVSFIEPEICKLSTAVLKEMAESEVYEDYSCMLEGIIREKKHILSAKEEKIMSEISSFTGDFQNVFMMLDNADLKFNKVKVDNEEMELSHGMYSVFLQNQDQSVRKEAFDNYYKAYRNSINTIAATYSASVKKDCTLSALRGYKSALQRALYADDIDKKVYNNLIKSVKKSTPALHKYVKYRKKALGLKELHMYDMYVSIVKDVDREYEYEDAYAMVLEALKPLGEDYRKIMERAYNERWIDVEETKNKRSGAYSWGIYDAPPYVLLNHQKTLHDVFVIAHEMGHAMHTYYSNANQCYEKADYRIFVAEIASTVNEVLLLKHLLKTASGEDRKYLLSYYLDMFRTTLFRQTMFAEFEKYAHEEYEQGRPLTAENMSAKYYELNEAYYGKGVIHDKDIEIEWARIPHFYNAFYVYKYATGLTTAVNIVNKLLTEEGYIEKYLKFLSTGGSLYPLPTIEIADVDLKSMEPFDFAMSEFKKTLDELVTL